LCTAEKKKFEELYGKENVDNGNVNMEEEVQEDVAVVVPIVEEKVEVKVEAKVEVPVRASRETLSPFEKDIKPELIAYLPHWAKLDSTDVMCMIKDVDRIVPEKGILYKSGVITIPCDDKDCVFPGTKVRTAMPDKVYNCPCCGKRF